MPDSSHGIPKKSGNGALIAIGILMLLVAGGLVAYKLSKGSEPEVVEELAPPPPPPAPAPVLDNAPPPPPSEEELAEEETKEDDTKKVVKGPSGPSGCGGTCTGSAGGDLKSALAARAASAKSCYNTALRRNATLEGKMTVNMRVSPLGLPCSVSVSNNTMGDPAVAACVSAQFRAAKFPAPQGGCVDTAIPLNFTAQK